MPVHPPVTHSLAQLQDWMKVHAPGVTFQSPANPAAIDNFAEKSGLTLPDDLRQLLLAADGETRKSAGAIGNWRLMPLAEIQAAWGWLSQLAAKGAFADRTPQPSPYLRQAWWHPGWIPFVSSDAGDYFCLDSDPPEPPRSGQVLLYLAERPQRPLVAASLGAWLDRITRDLASGVYAYDTVEGFDDQAFLRSSLESKHLLDDIPGKLIVQE
ncbi:MAG: SMI1/KNR4 family protein [Brevefilum sp.]